MAMGSKEDFFGGYDHAVAGGGAGLVHVGGSPHRAGKEAVDVGNHAFGQAWDRNLSDDGAPYIELMAGVFTDNQPDFSWLMPGETRTWSQFWYPIRAIGPAQKANIEAAVSLKVEGKRIVVGVATTREQPAALMQIWRGDQILHQCPAKLSPASPLVQEYVEKEAMIPGAGRAPACACWTKRWAGDFIQYQPAVVGEKGKRPSRRRRRELALPADVGSVSRNCISSACIWSSIPAMRTRLPEDFTGWRRCTCTILGESRCNTAAA